MPALLKATGRLLDHDLANLAVIDRSPPADDYARALVEGLASAPRAIPCRFFYDDRGSALFEAITALPEYYPTRTEIGLLQAHAREIGALAGRGVEIVELGAGASRKVRIVLDALPLPHGYLGIDVSRGALVPACGTLAGDYPALEVRALVADFTDARDLPPPVGRRLAFFPGSTIGNFRPDAAIELLSRWRAALAGGDMLVGVDLQKDPAALIAAYDDPAGVTAAFNLNLLVRANREAGTDFDLGGYRHAVDYDPMTGRVALYIESLREQDVHLLGTKISLAAGERVHTEDSWKYTVAGFRQVAGSAGFDTLRSWVDPDGRFSLHYLRARL